MYLFIFIIVEKLKNTLYKGIKKQAFFCFKIYCFFSVATGKKYLKYTESNF